MTQGYDPNDPQGQGGYQPPQYGGQPPPPPEYGSQPPPPQYGGYAPPPQYGGGMGGYPAAPQTDQNAVIALVVSLVALVVFCWPAGIVSLILGISSLRRINDSGGRLGGRGLAIAAIAVSIAQIVLLVVGAIGFAILAANSDGTVSGY
jgi:Domain of unknown function (DUF4190)